MIFDFKSEVFLGIDCSWSDDFVYLNYHQVWVLLDKSNIPALVQEEIVADGAELELRIQGLSKFLKALFECERNVPLSWFPF